MSSPRGAELLAATETPTTRRDVLWPAPAGGAHMIRKDSSEAGRAKRTAQTGLVSLPAADQYASGLDVGARRGPGVRVAACETLAEAAEATSSGARRRAQAAGSGANSGRVHVQDGQMGS